MIYFDVAIVLLIMIVIHLLNYMVKATIRHRRDYLDDEEKDRDDRR
jgi:hypothetical protein